MEITFLGTGTATPSARRNASGMAIRWQGHLVLVDIGPGTMRRMCEAGLDPKAVDAIFLTHFHPDHVSDLVPFLFASNYAFGPMRKEPFHVVGPEGTEQFYKALVGVYNGWIVPFSDRLLLKELSENDPAFVELEGLTVKSAPSNHSAAGRAYRFEANGASVTVSGDTDVSEEIVELALGADIFVCECSLPEGWKTAGHLTPLEAAAMARRAGVKKLVLTHFYPPCDEVDVVEQAGQGFSGEILKAEDLMVINV